MPQWRSVTAVHEVSGSISGTGLELSQFFKTVVPRRACRVVVIGSVPDLASSDSSGYETVRTESAPMFARTRCSRRSRNSASKAAKRSSAM